MASILRVNTLTDASSGNSIATSTIFEGTNKAWIYTNATGTTINDSFNVSTLTDTGTGQQQYTYTNNMNTDNNSITATHVQDGAGREFVRNISTTGHQQWCYKVASSAYYDMSMCSHVCGDLA
jgi:hypothetical protein